MSTRIRYISYSALVGLGLSALILFLLPRTSFQAQASGLRKAILKKGFSAPRVLVENDTTPDPSEHDPAQDTFVISYSGENPSPQILEVLSDLKESGQVSAIDESSEPGKIYVLGDPAAVLILRAAPGILAVSPVGEITVEAMEQEATDFSQEPDPIEPVEEPEGESEPDREMELERYYLGLAPGLPKTLRDKLVADLRADSDLTGLDDQGLTLRLVGPADSQSEFAEMPGVVHVAKEDDSASGVGTLLATGTITGVVTGSDTALPLSDVYVCAYLPSPYDYQCTYTDAQGRYTIAIQAGSNIQVWYYPDDYHIPEYYQNVPINEPSNYTPVSVSEGGITPNINAALEAGAQIIGTITDNSTGDPLQYIDVYTENSEDYRYSAYAYSNASGVYTTTPGLPPGTYWVRYTDYNEKYAREYYQNAYLFDDATLIELSTTNATGIDAALNLGGWISGTVTEEGTGTPLENIYVQVYDAATNSYINYDYTDASGGFLIGGFSPVSYKIRFQDFNGVYIQEYYDDQPDLNSADPIAVTSGMTETVSAQLVRGGVINGTVTEEGTGTPLEDIYVQAYDASTNSYINYDYTDASGVFQIGSLTTGSYKIRFQDFNDVYLQEYYEDQTDLASADPVAVTAGMTSTVSAQLAKGGVINGTLTEEGTGTPLEDIYVRAYDASTNSSITSDYSDASGVFRLGSLPTGSYKIRFQDFNGVYIGEYYDDQPDYDSADPIAVTAGMTSTVSAQLAKGGVINGTLTEEGTGTPLEDIYVQAYDAATNSYINADYTDASGVFRVGSLPTGSYKIRFQDFNGVYIQEYYDDQPDLNSADPIVVTAGMTSTISAQLVKGGVISGAVTGEGTGTPLEDIYVRAYDASTNNSVNGGYTDASGVFRVGSLPTGSYKIRFEDSNDVYIQEYYDDQPDLNSADPIAVTSGMTSTVSAQLAKGGVISGAVTEEGTSTPLEDIYVRAYDASTNSYINADYTDTSGVFRVGGLPTGSYKIRFEDFNDVYIQEYYDDKADLASADPVAVTAEMTATISAQLAQGGVISGTVTEEGTGTPLEDIYVRVNDAATNSFISADYTNASGVFRVGGLPTGSFKIQFQDFNGVYVGEYYDSKADLNSADPVAVTAGMTATISAQLAKGGVIDGNVTEEGTGTPLANVRVRIYEATTGSYLKDDTTDALGYYHLGGLGTGSYKLWFQDNNNVYIAEYFEDKESLGDADPVSVTAPMTTTINAELVLGGSITGRVTDENGAGVSGVSVSAQRQDSTEYYSASATSGTDGTYAIGSLPTGVYRVSFSPPQPYFYEYYDSQRNSSTFTPVVVTATMTTANVNASLTPGLLIMGTVTGPGPVANVYVRAYRGNNTYSSYNDWTASDGSYELGPMDPGQYRLQFVPRDDTSYITEWYDDATSYQDSQFVSLQNSSQNIDAFLEQGSHISGTVTGPSGEAVADVSVGVYQKGVAFQVASGETDQDGYYVTGPGLPPGDYQVYFSPPDGYTPEWYLNESSQEIATVVSIGSQNGAEVNAQLRSFEIETGAITGTLTAQDTGYPLAMWVYFYNAQGSFVDSVYANDGNYTASGLPTGAYHIRFNPSSPYYTLWYEGKNSQSDADLVMVTAGVTTTQINQTFPRGGVITGMVTGSGGLPGVYVGAQRVTAGDYSFRSTYSKGDGSYQIEGLAPGGYKLEFVGQTPHIPEWYGDASSIGEALTVTVNANTTTPNIDTSLATGGVITGTVTAADSGQPLIGLGVNVYNQWVYVDMDGYYQTLGLPAGEYQVYFPNGVWPEYIPEWYDSVIQGTATPVAVPASGVVPDINADLERGGFITGFVTDALTGFPVSGVSVYVYDAASDSYVQWGGSTNTWGSYLVSALLSGEYKLWYSRSGYISEFYGDTLDISLATPVMVNPPDITSGIDVTLVPLQYIYLPTIMRDWP